MWIRPGFCADGTMSIEAHSDHKAPVTLRTAGGHSPHPRPMPLSGQLIPGWAWLNRRASLGRATQPQFPVPPNTHLPHSKARTCSWIVWERRPLSAQLFWPSLLEQAWRQCEQVQDGEAETSRALGPLYAAGPLPGRRWGGREGSQGSWGNDPTSLHLCAWPTSELHICNANTLSLRHTHTHIQVYNYPHRQHALSDEYTYKKIPCIHSYLTQM